EQIQQIVRDAEAHADADAQRKELAELNNSAQSLLYTSEKAVEECADLVADDVLEQVRQDIAHLKQLIESGGEAGAIKAALQALELSSYKIAESLYGEGVESGSQ
ncbi:MAG: Hsp70 family protein, partial [Myxococcota bacterium]